MFKLSISSNYVSVQIKQVFKMSKCSDWTIVPIEVMLTLSNSSHSHWASLQIKWVLNSSECSNWGSVVIKKVFKLCECLFSKNSNQVKVQIKGKLKSSVCNIRQAFKCLNQESLWIFCKLFQSSILVPGEVEVKLRLAL